MFMSVCVAALVVLAFLGIFSAKYRRWAREAFDCVTRRLTLRPCRTGFNTKVKAKITSKLMKRHPGIARFTLRHFEAISWAFTALLFVSLLLTITSAFNLAVYGTCDPQNPDQCVFNPQNYKIECPDNCTPCTCANETLCEKGIAPPCPECEGGLERNVMRG